MSDTNEALSQSVFHGRFRRFSRQTLLLARSDHRFRRTARQVARPSAAADLLSHATRCEEGFETCLQRRRFAGQKPAPER